MPGFHTFTRSDFRTPHFVGIALGLVGALLVLSMSGGRRSPAIQTGPMLSECDGRIDAVVIQYVHGAGFAIPIYRQFLGALPADVRVYAAAADQSALDGLKSALGPLGARLLPVLTGHAMTAWSRDRWVALSPISDGAATILLAPQAENGAEIWPARLGDQRLANDLAIALHPGVASLTSSLYFDGGDFLADSRSVFVSPAVLRRNLQITVQSKEQLCRVIASALHRQVILLDDAPDHHAGMYMMAAGDNTVVVGDPSLGKPLLDAIDLPAGPDFTPETQRRFDSVAAAAAANHYRVLRIPVVPAADGKTYLTYVNGLIDQRDGQRTIYLPQYQNQSRLNDAGRNVWQSLGYRVVPIDVSSSFRLFGTLHCLVNVMEKG